MLPLISVAPKSAYRAHPVIKLKFVKHKAGNVNNKNDSLKHRQSLNKECRKRELQRITKENYQILRRIQDARPTYNHKKWEEEAKVNNQILGNICEFKPIEKRKFKSYQEDDILIDYSAFD